MDTQSKNQRGWRKIVSTFSPVWFSTTMGTGIISPILLSLPFHPYPPPWIQTLSLSLLTLNTFFFSLFLLLFLLRFALYPRSLTSLLRNPPQSLYLGTLPMAALTILNTFVPTCALLWGSAALTASLALWIFSSALGVLACLSMPFVLMYSRPRLPSRSLNAMTPAWLLPVVSPIVAAASGGVIAQALASVGRLQEAWATVVAAYCLWAVGIGLAMGVLVIYLQRMVLHGLLPKEVVVSTFLPLGPLGQGSYGVLMLGKVGRDVLPEMAGVPSGNLRGGDVMGEVLYVLSWWVAQGLWGYGLIWLFFAVVGFGIRAWRWRAPFGMAWWAFTFPLGVYAMATLELGREMESGVFDVFGTILAVTVMSLWLMVSVLTVRKVFTGEIFVVPRVPDLKDRESSVDDRR